MQQSAISLSEGEETIDSNNNNNNDNYEEDDYNKVNNSDNNDGFDDAAIAANREDGESLLCQEIWYSTIRLNQGAEYQKKDKKKVHDILPPWESKIDCECDESDGGGRRQIA